MEWEIFEHAQNQSKNNSDKSIEKFFSYYSVHEYSDCKNFLKVHKRNAQSSQEVVPKRVHDYYYLMVCWKLDEYNKVIKYCKQVKTGDTQEEVLLLLNAYLATNQKKKFKNLLDSNVRKFSQNRELKSFLEFYLLRAEYNLIKTHEIVDKESKDHDFITEEYKDHDFITKITKISDLISRDLNLIFNYFDNLESNEELGNSSTKNYEIGKLGKLYYKINYHISKGELHELNKNSDEASTNFNTSFELLKEVFKQNRYFFSTFGKQLLRLVKYYKSKEQNSEFFLLLDKFYDHSYPSNIYKCLLNFSQLSYKHILQMNSQSFPAKYLELIKTIQNFPYIDPHLIAKSLKIFSVIYTSDDYGIEVKKICSYKIELLKTSLFFWEMSNKKSIKLLRKIFDYLDHFSNEFGDKKNEEKFKALKSLKDYRNYFTYKANKQNFSTKIKKIISPEQIFDTVGVKTTESMTIKECKYLKNYKKPVKCLIKEFTNDEYFESELQMHEKLSVHGKYILKLLGRSELSERSLFFYGNFVDCSKEGSNFSSILAFSLINLFELLLVLKKNQIFIGMFYPENLVIVNKCRLKFNPVYSRLINMDGDSFDLNKFKNSVSNEFIAPELDTQYLKYRKFDYSKADVYALGIILLKLGYQNFNETELVIDIDFYSFDYIKEKIKNLHGCQWLKAFLRKMLCAADKRYSAIQLVGMYRKRFNINIG